MLLMMINVADAVDAAAILMILMLYFSLADTDVDVKNAGDETKC